MKANGAMQALTQQKLTGEVTRVLAHALMNDRQREEFAKEMECNFAISIPNLSRFRVNVYVQQQNVAMVVRTIASEIPNFEKLRLPAVLKDVIMNKRGLVLVVGGTGSGKSTSLAAMIDYRNSTRPATSSPWKTRWNTCTCPRSRWSATARSGWTRTAGTTR